LSGILGGSTGLGGILPTIWSGLRGWTSDEQRAVFQPVAVAIFVMAALWLGAQGTISPTTIELFRANGKANLCLDQSADTVEMLVGHTSKGPHQAMMWPLRRSIALNGIQCPSGGAAGYLSESRPQRWPTWEIPPDG
jgi:hypothetical protein